MYQKFIQEVIFKKEYVTRSDLGELLRKGGNVEDLLNYIGSSGDLMIGTQVGIKDKIISRQSLIIATTSGSNAIIDAIIVKKSKSIVNYKRINGDPNLIIDKKTSTREHGLVHILNSHAEFNNESHRSSEWKTYHQEVEIDISIEVKKDDFKYKISYLEI